MQQFVAFIGTAAYVTILCTFLLFTDDLVNSFCFRVNHVIRICDDISILQVFSPFVEYRAAYINAFPPSVDVLQSQVQKYMEEYDERVEKVSVIISIRISISRS